MLSFLVVHSFDTFYYKTSSSLTLFRIYTRLTPLSPQSHHHHQRSLRHLVLHHLVAPPHHRRVLHCFHQPLSETRVKRINTYYSKMRGEYSQGQLEVVPGCYHYM